MASKREASFYRGESGKHCIQALPHLGIFVDAQLAGLLDAKFALDQVIEHIFLRGCFVAKEPQAFAILLSKSSREITEPLLRASSVAAVAAVGMSNKRREQD